MMVNDDEGFLIRGPSFLNQPRYINDEGEPDPLLRKQAATNLSTGQPQSYRSVMMLLSSCTNHGLCPLHLGILFSRCQSCDAQMDSWRSGGCRADH